MMMPVMPVMEAKELFLKELKEVQGESDVDFNIEQLLQKGFFRAKLKNVTLFTDVGLIDGEFKVFTFVDGVCKRISSYKENCLYDFSLIKSKKERCAEMISELMMSPKWVLN